MDEYFTKKKLSGLIFTRHNINPKFAYSSIDMATGKPIKQPDEPIWWSHLSGRYRDADEQNDFIMSGCIDKKIIQNEP